MNNLLNFKSFFKFLGRNKAYTLIDVFGLSVSLMFVLLIAVYTVQEMSTDKFHTKADRIYLVGNENWMATGAAIPYKIKERYPEVEKVCPVVAGNSSDIVVVSGDRKLKANVMFADSTFFDFFDFRLLQGCLPDSKNHDGRRIKLLLIISIILERQGVKKHPAFLFLSGVHEN